MAVFGDEHHLEIDVDVIFARLTSRRPIYTAVQYMAALEANSGCSLIEVLH